MNSSSSSMDKDKHIAANEPGFEQVENAPNAAVADPCLNPADNVSYGRTGFRGVVDSPFVFGAALLASLGGFSFGYDQGVISIINTMDQFHKVFPEAESAFGTGFMTAMLELGAFLGCFFMPTLCDKISRKWALTTVVVIFNIGAIMQAAATSYGVLVAGRTIAGIGVGTLAMGAPIYISEIAPPNLRGTLLVLESVSIVGGVVISYWITYGTRHLQSEAAFRIPFGLQMVSATILGTAIHFFPFSPRWLALVGRNEDSLTSITKLRRLPADDHRVQAEYHGILTEVNVHHRIQEKRHPGVRGIKLELAQWADLARVWRRTILACGFSFFQQFMGINAFIYYAPTLFESLGQSTEMALVLSGIFNILQWVGVGICFVIIDKVGRRALAISGGAITGAAWMVLAALVGLYSSDWSSHIAAGWAAVAMAFIFVIAFGATFSCLAWAVPAEVFPNTSRAKGVAAATVVNWFSNFVVGLATPPMIESLGFGTYIFYGSFCLMAAVWAFFCVPETMGKTLEQMDALFKDGAAEEEKAVMRSEMAGTSQHLEDAKPVGVV